METPDAVRPFLSRMANMLIKAATRPRKMCSHILRPKQPWTILLASFQPWKYTFLPAFSPFFNLLELHRTARLAAPSVWSTSFMLLLASSVSEPRPCASRELSVMVPLAGTEFIITSRAQSGVAPWCGACDHHEMGLLLWHSCHSQVWTMFLV